MIANAQVEEVSVGQVVVRGNCVFCGQKVQTSPFSVTSYQKWQAGELIQRAIPELDVDDREFLISGICKECFPK